MILISNDQTSASKKINGMELISTLTVSTNAFERMKEKFYGFWQTEKHRVPITNDFFMKSLLNHRDLLTRIELVHYK